MLRAQRKVLEQKRRQIERAIEAVPNAAEAIAGGKRGDAFAFKRIIEVIRVREDVAAMKKYYSEEAWAQWSAQLEQEPSRG